MRNSSKLAAALIVTALLGATPHALQQPPVMGRNAGVSAGHPLTTAAAFEVLTRGGNAFDAGVAAMLVGGVVEQDLYSLGGEGLVLVYPRSTRKVVSIVGQGWAPKAATIDWYTYTRQRPFGPGARPGSDPGSASCGTDGARTMGHDEVRAGLGQSD